MIKYLDLKKINAMHEQEILSVIEQTVKSGWYLHGQQLQVFENSYAKYIGTDYCIGCANGLDALYLILRAYITMGIMQEGDEVVVPANTFIASILAITQNRLKPVFVEPDIHTLQIDDTKIERAISNRTRAVMIVHLYGRCAYTENIGQICQTHGLKLIEDNAQAHGCYFYPTENRCANSRNQFANGNNSTKNIRTGSIGDAAAHSFYPGKNLGAMGNGGAITTNDSQLASIVRTLGNYGFLQKYHAVYQGRNSRLDDIQAAVLSVKLKYLDQENLRRKAIARRYETEIIHDCLSTDNSSRLRMTENNGRDNVYHIFPIFCSQRKKMQDYLAQCNISTNIHYPIPPHKQQCYREFATLNLPITEQIHCEELSLPCHQAMTDDEVSHVIASLNEWVNQQKN